MILVKIYPPPIHCAAMKKAAFNTEILSAAIIEIVKAGLTSPPETCSNAITKVAMVIPWLKAMCITEGGVLFHGRTVPQARKSIKSVAKNSATTWIQNDLDRSSILPSWINMSVRCLRCFKWNIWVSNGCEN